MHVALGSSTMESVRSGSLESVWTIPDAYGVRMDPQFELDLSEC